MGKVVYAAGVNEKLLGDFIRKHNLRDKIFSGLFY
jgi:aryl-alcohol dehydrogenase-like predicted oxidoreductase